MKYRLVRDGETWADTRPQAFATFELARDYARAMAVTWRISVEVWKDRPGEARPMDTVERAAP